MELLADSLIANLDRLHTTPQGAARIRRNLSLGEREPVAWCRERILDPAAVLERRGKNWYVRADGCEITVNAGSLTIITARREKPVNPASQARSTMLGIYETSYMFESARFLVRPPRAEDCAGLARVYGDKDALPFFNGDGTNGDTFYYPTEERMAKLMAFWRQAYENRWFVRMVIVDKTVPEIVGSVDLCTYAAERASERDGVLRVDVRSDREREDMLHELFQLIAPRVSGLLGCESVLTKAWPYAAERMNALRRAGFAPSDRSMTGNDGCLYGDYWIKTDKTEHVSSRSTPEKQL